ncbi:hypothetical protein [Bradyrhizobium sp. CB3481]|uniref:hypothetical protein n=1 Tax=Bradyrhizobium sp. CB3481 TaxID=3039158 RepID=UPI0024B16611|nr:hypothetical protein [Bradyrhizobium sp. CB3481]WFU19936.1 hypothetical protein QA643_17195 [Bradyrhizobium sp. CB3481]
MEALIKQAQAATDELLEKDEDELFERLAVNLRAIAQEPAQSGKFELNASLDVEKLGPLDGLADLGKRYFQNVEAQIHSVVCGAADSQTRAQLANSFGLGREAVAATIAALLVSQVGFAPAVAAVLGTLTIRIFFDPAHKTMCEKWSERIEGMKRA